MKTRRLFQVASAMLAIVFGVAMIAIAVLTILPFVINTQLGNEGILKDFHQGAISVAADLPFLQIEGNLGAIIYVLVAYVLPGLLLIVAALLLFGKRKKSQAKYYFADVLIFLAALLFTVLFVMFAKKLFGDERAIAWIIGACAGAFLLLFLVIVSLASKKKGKTQKVVANDKTPKEKVDKRAEKKAAKRADKKADLEKQADAQTAETNAQPTTAADTQTAATADVKRVAPERRTERVPEVSYEQRQAEAAKRAAEIDWEAAFQAKTAKSAKKTAEQSAGKATEQQLGFAEAYIPHETSSMSDLVAQTYGNKEAKPRKNNWEKIEKLRELLELNAITRDEYTALVNAYLKEEELW